MVDHGHGEQRSGAYEGTHPVRAHVLLLSDGSG